MNQVSLNSVKPEYSQVDITLFSLSEKLELDSNFIDNETVEVLSNSESIEEIELLWGDLTVWL